MANFDRSKDRLITNQLVQRAAVKSALQRGKLFVSGQTFGSSGVSARVLYEGEYFDVGELDLAKLKAGKTPTELGLEPSYDE